MAEQKSNFWGFIGVIALCLFIIFILFFFRSNNINSNEPVEKNNTLEVITISGMNSKETITTSKPSQVFISGLGAEVTFSISSNPQEIFLSGMDSKAYLCNKIHNPVTHTSGLRSEVIYKDC
jgi:tRNA A22 N-methylase